MTLPYRFLFVAIPVLLLALLVVWLPRLQTPADPLVEQASEAVEAPPLTPAQAALDTRSMQAGSTLARWSASVLAT